MDRGCLYFIGMNVFYSINSLLEPACMHSVYPALGIRKF